MLVMQLEHKGQVTVVGKIGIVRTKGRQAILASFSQSRDPGINSRVGEAFHDWKGLDF